MHCHHLHLVSLSPNLGERYMEDIYKILAAAVVGFVLSPLTEIIKTRIGISHSKKRLTDKIKLSTAILANAINTLNSTATKREDFIKSRTLEHQGFLLPYLKIPKLDDDFEKAYPSLSRNQREIIEIAIYGMAHLIKLEAKAEKADEDLKEALNETKYTDVKEIKETHNRYYKRILSCEKAMLYSLISIRKNLQLAVEDSQQKNTDSENFASTAEELGVKFNLSWWPNLSQKQEKLRTGIAESERI